MPPEDEVTETTADETTAAEKPAKAKKKKKAKAGGDKKASKKTKADKKPVDKKAKKDKKAGDKKKPKKGKVKVEKGGMSSLAAAAKVLELNDNEPMTLDQMIDEMAAKKLWKSKTGKTPRQTLSSVIQRDILNNGKKATFKRAGRGLFQLRG